MTTALLIIGILLLSASIVLTYRPVFPAAPVAFLGLLAVYFTPQALYSLQTLYFWGAATLIVVGIAWMLPRNVQRLSAGMSFIATGALAGAIVGLIVSLGGMVIGACLGVFFGMIAFSRTPGGKRLRFPSQPFLQYMCCKGLPAVVTMCMVGLVVASLITNHSLPQ